MRQQELSAELVHPGIAGLDSAIAWLRDAGLAPERIASLFKIRPNHVRQLAFRGKHSCGVQIVHPFLIDPLTPPENPFAKPSSALRETLRVVRPHEDSVILDRAERRRLEGLEQEIETRGVTFWTGVRFETGLAPLFALLPKIGYPAHHHRIRLLARLQQLICETLLHSGRSASAIDHGLRSLHLYRIAQHESGFKADFENIGRSARLIAQGYLLRAEPVMSQRFLAIHRQACDRAGVKARPEYYEQMATIAFQQGEYGAARPLYQRAMQELGETVDYGRPRLEHEVLDIGARQMNLLPPVDWEKSRDLLNFMVNRLAPGDIHVSISANWTAACGFLTDSTDIQKQAREMLDHYGPAAEGYGHQATCKWLLSLTPELPGDIRAPWARRVLYENALRNS